IVYGPEMTDNVFEYEMHYEITVQDTSGLPSFYDLGDTLKFDESATIHSITVTYTGDDGLQTSILTPNPSGTEFKIVENEEIDSLRADVYHVAVVFEVDPVIYSASTAKCKEGD